jgi:general L-amino acid transport system permease protein
VLSLTCIVAATLLGMAVALARVSPNPTLSGLAAAYVEAIRNVPLLLQLLAWYFVVVRSLPTPRNAYSFLGVGFLSNRGLYLPAPDASAGFVVALFAGLGLACAVSLSAWIRKSETGRAGRRVWLAPAALVGVPLLALATGLANLHWSVPVLRGFNYTGGLKLVPEFIAMMLGLSIYSSAFLAEVFRGGINAVGRGQREAALSLGMRPWLVNWKVVIPLALRVVVPPLGGQYVLLLKNSSLAAAIAYPDLMQVMAGTAVNQTGQPLEVMFMTLATYVLLGLMIAAATNLWNYRLKLRVR